MDKLTIRKKHFVLFVWNNSLVADVTGACAIGGTAPGLASISGVLSISDIKQSFRHDNSSSILQFIKIKPSNVLVEHRLLCLMCYY